jgi:hypothetical protein
LAQGVKATGLDEYLHVGPRRFSGWHRKRGANLGADRVNYLGADRVNFWRGKSNFLS